MRFLLLCCLIANASLLFAQENETQPKHKTFSIFKKNKKSTSNFSDTTTHYIPSQKQTSNGNAVSKNADHLMIQFGYTNWMNRPDSLKTSAIPHVLNVYAMYNMPLKFSKNLSFAFGLGVGTNSYNLKSFECDINANTNPLVFQNKSNTDHFKRFKVATALVQVPLELRYTRNPDNYQSSFKVALGVKGGLLLSAWTKGAKLVNANKALLSNYKEKVKSNQYFNPYSLSATLRVGWGNFSLFGEYSFVSFLKNSAYPVQLKPYSIGISLSGL